jgi:lysophospholipase L1-like esterase
MTQEFTILSAEWPAAVHEQRTEWLLKRRPTQGSALKRTGFAIALLWCALAAGACSAHGLRPASAVSGAVGKGLPAGAAAGGGFSRADNTAAVGAASNGSGASGDMTGPTSAGQPSGDASHAGQSSGNAELAGPRFIGRFDQSNPDAAVFAWPGTAIALRFTGTEIGVTLTDEGSNVFEVVLDGQHQVLALQPGTRKYMLGSGLAPGAHELLLYRRTEPSFKETTFNGFDLPMGAYLPSAPPPKRRLEVIGDSISAGYGNEGVHPCAFTPATENQYLSYEAIAARALNAELYTEAWSGIGVIRNYEGAGADVMPVRYPRTLPERATSAWDFSKFVPDAVVINLGTNDFAKGDPGAAFQRAYSKFVGDLRSRYPAARFFLALGPMLKPADYRRASRYLKAVIAERASAGDENLALLEFGIQNAKLDGLGCDYHPSLKTHQRMAEKLQAALKTELGW